MFEPQDKTKKGGSRTGGPTQTDQRRVVQPLSVVRGNRVQTPPPPVEPPHAGEAVPEVVEAPRPVAPPAPSGALLQLWAMLNQRNRWSSLVVVPSHEGGSGLQAVQSILEVANQIGRAHV